MEPPLSMGTDAPQLSAPIVSNEAAVFFREQILEWARVHGRTFPWRLTRNPYHILAAEMMLRRTQARQVVPIYERFLTLFPSVQDLAFASEQDVADALYSLGLAWRSANFRRMAEHICTRENGQIPEQRDHLLSIPGVGDYVASAVRCMAFDQDETLIDTNTVRVAGRYFGFPTHAESRRSRPVQQAVRELIDHNAPRASNLGLLDFAATVCQASKPLCYDCPVNSRCSFFENRSSSSSTT